MDDQRIAVEAAEPRGGPGRGPMVAGAALLAGVVIFIASSDFTGADEAAERTSTVVTSTVPITTTLPTAVVERAVRSASLTAEDLAEVPITWRPVSSPDGIDLIAAVGRFRDQVVAIGGPTTADGLLAPLRLVGWSDFDVWFPVGTITERPVIVELAVIDPNHLLIVARSRADVDHPGGELFLYTSSDGVSFDESPLLASDIEVLSAGHARGTTWIFGLRTGDRRHDVIRALPRTIGELVVTGQASMYYEAGTAVVVAPMNIELGRYRFDDLLPGQDPPDVRSVQTVTWAISEAGGVRAAGVPFDGALAEHVRRTELGDLVAQVYVPEAAAYHEWLSVDGETWRELLVWEGARGSALGGVGSRSLYGGSTFSPAVMVIDDAAPALVTFHLPGHEINPSKASTVSSPDGALLSTGRFGGLNLSSEVLVERDGMSLTVTSTGVATVSTARGAEVISAALPHLVELGYVDTSARRLYLGDVDGTVLMHVTFEELAALERTRQRRADDVGLLFSRDLVTWSYSELPIGGEVVAAHVGPDLAMVVIDDDLEPPWVWVARP